jgi:hypothetical protein
MSLIANHHRRNGRPWRQQLPFGGARRGAQARDEMRVILVGTTDSNPFIAA